MPVFRTLATMVPFLLLVGACQGPGTTGARGGVAALGTLALAPATVTVGRGGEATVQATGGEPPYRWALSSGTSRGTVTGQPDLVPFAAAPALGGAALWQQWGHGQSSVLQDKQGNGQLLTFAAPGATGGTLQLLTSADQGQTWTGAQGAAGLAVASDSYAGVMALAQDSGGAVHLLFYRSGFLDVVYYRLQLLREAGAVTGYAPVVGPVVVPGAFHGDRRGQVVAVQTAAGAEVLAVLVTASDASGTRLQAWLSVTAGTAPSSAADFLSLAGVPGSSSLVLDDARGTGASHDHHALLGQLGSTRDLWVFAGNVPAEPAPTSPTALVRVRLAASGATWVAGPPQDGATTGAWLLAVLGARDHVWAMEGRYADGQVRFARVDAAGTLEEPVAALPSPVSDGRGEQTMFGAFNLSADETQLWAVYTRDPGPGGRWYDFTPTAAWWDGTRWHLQADLPQGDSGAVAFAEGLAGSSGLATGVVVAMTRTDGTAFNGPLRLATLRALPGGAPLSSQGRYRAGPAPGTDVVTVTDATGATASATVTVSALQPVVAPASGPWGLLLLALALMGLGAVEVTRPERR